jgi:hypothetical protein
MAPCPFGECVPVDTPLPFGHTAPCPDCPHVACERCGARAETVTPDELAAAWPVAPLPGQVSWLD